MSVPQGGIIGLILLKLYQGEYFALLSPLNVEHVYRLVVCQVASSFCRSESVPISYSTHIIVIYLLSE